MSSEEVIQAKIDRLEAPIKPEFCRLESSRVPYVEFLGLGGQNEGSEGPKPSKNALRRASDHPSL
jgi:hypothetical protein